MKSIFCNMPPNYTIIHKGTKDNRCIYLDDMFNFKQENIPKNEIFKYLIVREKKNG